MKNIKTAKRIVSAVRWVSAFLIWFIWHSVAPDEFEWIGLVIAIGTMLLAGDLVNHILLPETKKQISRLSHLPDILEKETVFNAFKESVTDSHRIIYDDHVIRNFLEALSKKRSFNIQNEDILFLYSGEEKPKPNKLPKYSGLMSCAGAILVTTKRLIALDVGWVGPKKELADIPFNRISQVESGRTDLKILMDNGKKHEIIVLDEDNRAMAQSILNICEG